MWIYFNSATTNSQNLKTNVTLHNFIYILFSKSIKLSNVLFWSADMLLGKVDQYIYSATFNGNILSAKAFAEVAMI